MASFGDLLNYGVQTQHDSEAFPRFLKEIWNRREELARWGRKNVPFAQEGTLPVFLHGGSARGKVLVMGINPGRASDVEKRFVSTSAASYADFHEQFYRADMFPRICQEAQDQGDVRRNPPVFWHNARIVVAELFGRQTPKALSAGAAWADLAEMVVAQDVIPFHSPDAGALTNELDSQFATGAHSPLVSLACASLSSVSESCAKLVLVCSPVGFRSALQVFPTDLRVETLAVEAKRGTYGLEVAWGRLGAAVPLVAMRYAAFSAMSVTRVALVEALRPILEQRLGLRLQVAS